MLHIRRETSDRSETLGKPVIPRLRTTAWAGSTRHQEAIVLTTVGLTPNWTKGQKRAASEADVAGFEGRMGVDAMRACTDPSVYPQYDLQYQECDCFVLGTSEDGIRMSHAYLRKKGILQTHLDATKVRFIEYQCRGQCRHCVTLVTLVSGSRFAYTKTHFWQ